MPDLYEIYAAQQTEELVEILDNNGRAFMVMALNQAQKQNLCYQVTLSLLYCPQGFLYLQQRSKQSPLYPEFWDISGFAPVRANEAAIDSVSRSLYETLRVRPTHCRELISEPCEPAFGRHIKKVFQALAPSQIPAPDSRYIDRLIKVSQNELNILLDDFSDQISPMLRYVGEKGLTFKKD